MKAKVVVSLGTVVGLAVLSAAAFISTAGTAGASPAVGQREEMQAVICQEEPAIKEKEGRLSVETVSLPEAAEEPPQTESGSLSPEDSYLLAKIAMAEAESEDTEGKALVMLVVLNRVKAGGFPDSVEEVIYQARQFSPVASGRFDRVEPDADCWLALSLIEVDGWDESMGATYFESESESTWHEEHLEFLFQHGNHYFYTDKEGGR